MKKAFVCIFSIVLVVACYILCHENAKNSGKSFITTIPIQSVISKHYDEDYFITLVLDENTVQEYGLKNNEVVIKVTKSIYNEVTMKEKYVGASLEINNPNNFSKSDLGMILKGSNTEWCRIISLTKKDNTLLE